MTKRKFAKMWWFQFTGERVQKEEFIRSIQRIQAMTKI